MKLNKAYSALAGLFLLASNVSAYVGNIKVQVASEVEHCTGVVYDSFSTGECFFKNQSEKQQELTSIASRFIGIEHQIKNKMRADLLAGLDGYKLSKLSFNMDDNMIFKFIGGDNGNIDIMIGGFSFSGYIKVEKDFWAKASIQFGAQDVWLKGTYNVSTGKITDLQNSNVALYVNKDVDTIFGIIPFVDNLIEDFAYRETDINKQVEEVYNDINNALNQEYQFFGLDQKIPDNTFVYNGVDYGRMLKDDIAGLFEGESLEIELGGYLDVDTYAPGIEALAQGKPGTQFIADISSRYFNITFSDRLKINTTTKNIRYYELVPPTCDVRGQFCRDVITIEPISGLN